MKRWIAMGLCLALLCMLAGCRGESNPYLLTSEQESQREDETREAVRVLNESSNFGCVQLLQPYDGPETYVNSWIEEGSDTANSLPAFGPPSIMLSDEEGYLVLSAYYWFYPRTTEDMMITQIELYSPEIGEPVPVGYPYHVFEVKPGMDQQAAIEKLEKRGYAIQKPEGPYEVYEYAAGKHRIILRCADVLVMLDSEKEGEPIEEVAIEVFDVRIKPKLPREIY